MQLDIRVKYQRIANKFLEGIIRLFILLIFFSIFQYLFKESFEFKSAIVSFGGMMLIFLAVAIINETIDYNQKFYEILSNKNYLKVQQSELLNLKIENKSKFINQIENQILASKMDWLISKKENESIEFQTKRKSFLGYLLQDKVTVKINDDNISIKSCPLNKVVFLDSSRNLGNIQFVKRKIKKGIS